jgi:TPR repeat protein
MHIKYLVSSLALATSLALISLPTRAETAGEACDRLATHSSIKSKPENVKGVSWAEIDPKAAIMSCAAAVTAYPDVARYHIQYGRALNKAGKNDQALAEYEIGKKSGLIEANIFLSEMYLYGDLGAVDYEKALALNLEAAENGVGFAANTLGIWYRNGDVVAKDLEKSLSWLRKSHELGDKNVGVDLGFAYEHGLAVKVDKAEALRWYRIAADAGNGLAMNNLGAAYSNGVGVAKDAAKAMVWFRKAEAEKIPLAYINVALFTDHGTETKVDHKLAAEYVVKAFDAGDKWTDPYNRDAVMSMKWTPAFWREMQETLKQLGHYTGPIDGTLTQATKDALEKIVDK